MKSSKRIKFKFTWVAFALPVSFLVTSINAEQLNTEFLQHFRNFSNDLISGAKETTEATEIKPGLHMFNPFGVAILLAHINEKVWNVPTNGIPAALHTPKKAIASEYAQLLRQFRRSKFRISNTVYSRYSNLTRPMAFDQFLTHIINLDFTNQTSEFLDSFNSFIDLGTKGHLNNEIVPKQLWRKVFENATMGSYLNTLYYKGMWDDPWTNIGDMPFNFDSFVPYIESRGLFKIAETPNITAVLLDIQGQTKKLVLFKAHTYMDTPGLREEFLKVYANSSLWSLQNFTVQVPAVNATNMARHHLGLSHIGVNDTFCRHNMTDQMEYYYSQQPITQGNHFEISANYVELASASGALVNYQNDDPNLTDPEFSEDYYDDDYEVLDTEPEVVGDDIEEHVNSRQFKNRQRFRRNLNVNTKPLGGCGRPDDFAATSSSPNATQSSLRTILKQGRSDRVLTFDTPFSWMFLDHEIGEVFYGHVSSLCQFNKATNAIYASPTHAWLHDVFKVAFWKCLSR